MPRKLKLYITAILLPLAAGSLSMLITKGSYTFYNKLKLPFFAPPGYVFPIVWSILYILMGISSAMVYTTPSPHRYSAVKLYLFQLVLNFFWPIIFFKLEAPWLALAWILLLTSAVIAMTIKFYAVKPLAGALQLPYVIWSIFAAILNLFVVIMN